MMINGHRLLMAVVVAVGLTGRLAAGEARAPNKTPGQGENPKAEQPESPVDPFKVPEGTSEDLLKFIQDLPNQVQPRNPAEFRKMNVAMSEAAFKVIESAPTDEQLAKAAETARVSLAALAQMGNRDAVQKLAGLFERLDKSGKTDLARPMKKVLLGLELRRGPGASPAQLKRTIDEIKACLAEAPMTQSDAALAMSAAMAAEYSDDQELAINTYESLGKLLAASEVKMLAELAKRFEGVIRRLKLVGNEMKIEGNYLSGDKFDAQKHTGKVLLVDFWATWCGPCRAETPHLKEAYEKYHDKGFDIVGISLDRDRKPLDEYIKDKSIPWDILYEEGGKSVTANYYGVMGIPAMILVGPDGKVVSTKARGSELTRLLEKLLGPIDPPKPDEKLPNDSSNQSSR